MFENKEAWKAIRTLISMCIMIGIYAVIAYEVEDFGRATLIFAILFVVTYVGHPDHTHEVHPPFSQEIHNLELKLRVLNEEKRSLLLQMECYHSALSSIAYAPMCENQMRQIALEEVEDE